MLGTQSQVHELSHGSGTWSRTALGTHVGTQSSLFWRWIEPPRGQLSSSSHGLLACEHQPPPTSPQGPSGASAGGLLSLLQLPEWPVLWCFNFKIFMSLKLFYFIITKRQKFLDFQMNTLYQIPTLKKISSFATWGHQILKPTNTFSFLQVRSIKKF